MEIWKEIKGGKVSHKGRVFGKRKILTPVINNGYAYVMLKHNGKYKHYAIHRLVTEAFIPNPDNKPEVNHIDGDKSNNVVYNLEWCTGKENKIHAYNTGLSVRGERHTSSKLTTEDVLEIRKLKGLPLIELSERFGVTKMCISKIQNNKTWKHL